MEVWDLQPETRGTCRGKKIALVTAEAGTDVRQKVQMENKAAVSCQRKKGL